MRVTTEEAVAQALRSLRGETLPYTPGVRLAGVARGMDSKIQQIKQSWGQYQAAKQAERDAGKDAASFAKRMRQEHERAVEAFNAHMPPALLTHADDLKAHLALLDSNEMVRPCFITHEGKPTSYPCLIVSVRTVAQYETDVRYAHRFVYPADAFRLVVPESE